MASRTGGEMSHERDEAARQADDEGRRTVTDGAARQTDQVRHAGAGAAQQARRTAEQVQRPDHPA